jgi:hypothetical protein
MYKRHQTFGIKEYLMKKALLTKLAFIACLTVFAGNAAAIPTLQTYIDGATAGDYGLDEDTWFSQADSFTLYVVGAYGPTTASLDEVTLLVSVPEGETGTITFTTSSDYPVLISAAGINQTQEDADTDILVDIPGDDGYSAVQPDSFPPFDSNNHYPLHDDVSDYLIYDLGSFDDASTTLYDYNADDGNITAVSGVGEQKEYTVYYTGFSGLHFDVYGLVTKESGKQVWVQNPGSHDSTASSTQVPEPGTLLLVGAGLVGLWMGRRRYVN